MRVLLEAGDPEYMVQYLDGNYIDAGPFTNESIYIDLDQKRGDEIIRLADGRLRITQDAMVCTIETDIMGVFSE